MCSKSHLSLQWQLWTEPAASDGAQLQSNEAAQSDPPTKEAGDCIECGRPSDLQIELRNV
jgi:hypothetical protein